MKPLNPHRRFDADHMPLWAENGRSQHDAEQGSALLADRIMLHGLNERPAIARQRSFEEQIALIESGRAHIVSMPDLRPYREEQTLAGVSTDWMMVE